ncbi:unnamed protein product [Chrysodeixis includens]|uniref:Uncharacterized protein n=1 Tax=Chrysodeixis includens TaxID=689277 RepID=A0A9N8KTV8_CHRIL|nr:unnamed protein product [Chrysodeixis includens]
MMMVALLSATYHICPNQLNFQFGRLQGKVYIFDFDLKYVVISVNVEKLAQETGDITTLNGNVNSLRETQPSLLITESTKRFAPGPHIPSVLLPKGSKYNCPELCSQTGYRARIAARAGAARGGTSVCRVLQARRAAPAPARPPHVFTVDRARYEEHQCNRTIISLSNAILPDFKHS